jgi:DNA repair exonuclease SbcCD ATPase subunit
MHARLEVELSRNQHESKNLQKDLEEIEKLHKKFPNFAKQKQKLIEELLQIEQQVAEHKGMAFSHATSMEHLHKAKANCPVCERDLPKEMKETLKAIEECLLP